MKINRSGQAKILEDGEYNRITDALTCPRDKLLCAILFYTGERIGAVVQLRVESVYTDPAKSKPSDLITFSSKTRKGKKDTRQIPIHSALKEILGAYQPPAEGYLFPSKRSPGSHLSKSAFDKLLRSALKRAGLTGISSHSFRRTFITTLHKKKVGIRTIQAITKHRKLESLAAYIEVQEDEVRNAIAMLSE